MRTKRHDTRGADGMTLLEVLGYVAILAVVINLGAASLVSTIRLNGLGIQGLDKARALETLRSDFLETVHASSGVCAQIGTYRSSDTQLVLQLPPSDEQPGCRRFAVFAVNGDRTGLIRSILVEENGNYRVDSLITYPLDVLSIRFRHDTASPQNAQLISLEVTSKADGPTRLLTATPRSLRPGATAGEKTT